MQESQQTTVKKKKFKYAVSAALLIIILSQMTVICYWMTQRRNLYIDELYSLGYAQSYTLDSKDVMYFYKTPEWKYETWIENESIRNHLETSDEESLFSQPPLTAINMMLQRRNYFGILNIIMSVFSPNRISAYPGIIFNILLFFLIQLLIYRITKELSGRCVPAILAVVMYGFSIMAVNMTLYIRFYSLVIVLLIGVIRIHQIMWRTERIGLFELLTVVTIALLYLALRNSELVFIFAGALVFSFIFTLIVSRQYRKALCYLVTTVPIGLFYVIRKTNLIDIILHPAKYQEKNWPVNKMTNSVLNMSPSLFAKNVKSYIKLFALKLFGSRYVLFGFAGIILILSGIWVFRRIRKIEQEKNNSNNRVFFWAVFGVAFIYLLFCGFTSAPGERYLSLIFPLVSILLFCVVSFLASEPKVRKWTLPVCIVLTLYGVFLQQVVDHNFKYVYPGDEKAIKAIEDSGIRDTIVIFCDVSSGGEHAVYDCVYLLPDSAHIYPVDDENNRIDVDGCPDTVLIWTHRKTDIDPYVDELTSGAFQVQRIGRTHASDIYLAQRVFETEETP